MMRLNVGLKSTLLALAVLVAVPTTTTCAEQVPAPVSNAFCSIQPVPVAMAVAFALWVRFKTKSDKEQFKSKPADDYKKLVESFDPFDAAFYKHLVMLFDKYVIGRKIKFESADIPEDGRTIKGKKVLTQEPYGALGLFDAYVLSQIEDFSKNIPMIAGFYVLLGSPHLPWQGGIKKASGDK